MPIYTIRPKNKGEQIFADFVDRYINTFHVWFNVIFPRAGEGKEGDIIMYYHGIDAIIIGEVKGWDINYIERIAQQYVQLTDRIEQNPWNKTAEQARKWSTYFKKGLVTKKIAVLPVVIFTNISRKDYYDNMKAKVYEVDPRKQYGDGTVFSDDIIDLQTYLERLKIIQKNPVFAVRNNCIGNSELNNEDINKLNELIKIPLENKFKKAYDPSRILSMENELKKRNINRNTIEVITGKPGSGKTFFGFYIAREMAQMLSNSKKKVLFTCYNKTLATDINRIRVCRYPDINNLKVADIFQLLSEVNNTFPNLQTAPHDLLKQTEKKEKRDHDIWAKKIVDKLIEANLNDQLDEYEYVVVDEAQDIKDYGWDFIELISKRKMLIIYDEKQVFYTQGLSSYLLGQIDKAKKERKHQEFNKIFRQTEAGAKIAQAFLYNFPRIAEAKEYIKKGERKDKTPDTIDLYTRPGGKYPEIIISNGEINDYKCKIKNVLLQLFKENEELNGVGSDIILLIPYDNWAKSPIIDVLKELGKPYIDYTNDENKRDLYYDEEVRICSYFSSRGLEGNYVIALGFNYLSEFVKNLPQKPRREYVGYVALSRAVYDTKIICIEDLAKMSEETKFIKELINYSQT